MNNPRNRKPRMIFQPGKEPFPYEGGGTPAIRAKGGQGMDALGTGPLRVSVRWKHGNYALTEGAATSDPAYPGVAIRRVTVPIPRTVRWNG